VRPRLARLLPQSSISSRSLAAPGHSWASAPTPPHPRRRTQGACAVEDLANRRLNAVPGVFHVLLVLYPMTRPEVILTTAGPSIFHAHFSPVSADKPEGAGEVLIAAVRGLDPTRPGLDPSQPFPPYEEDEFCEVNSPV